MKLDGIRQKVFLDRYALKDAEGHPIEQDPPEMWRRVAKGIAGVEKKEYRKKWEEKFYNVMEDFKFLPGGRILAGAGTGFDVTYFNCFVIPNPPDSRGGIMENLTQMIEIMAHGGGVGLNLSGLRPRGARVKKVNGFSSGPMNWAELYSLATKDIVQQGGSRRGALMLMIHDWHPDVEEFITVKQDMTKINGANLSVCVSDDFMEAVKKDQDWDLLYPDLDDPTYDLKWKGDIHDWKKNGGRVKVYKTIKASYLWNLICEAAWRSAEPGLHFLDRSNKQSNTWYFEKLLATNPSLRAGTRVLTKQGIFTIEALEGKKFLVKNLDGKWSEAECFLSGRNKQLYKITLSNGREVYATAEHKWPVFLVGGGFGKVTTDKLQAGNILPFPKAQNIEFDSQKVFSREQGLMLGWLYGDGWISERGSRLAQVSSHSMLPAVDGAFSRNVRNFSPQTSHAAGVLPHHSHVHNFDVNTKEEILSAAVKKKKMVFGFLFSEEDKVLSGVILDEINKLKTVKSNLTKAHNNTYTIQATSSEFAGNLSSLFGVDKKENGLPKAIWESGSEFIKGFVDGLISSDGFIAKNAHRIIFTTKHKRIAEDVSTLLSFYGIKSNIRRSESQLVKFPNGKNYYKTYERYDVSIDGYHAVNFGKIFTLSHPRKQKNLERIVSEYKQSRALPDEGLIRIQSVEKTDIAENVWDIRVYDDTHCFYINHCITGNCGEQPLGAWAVCNLGAMNLVAYVKPARNASASVAGGDEKFDYDSFGKDVQIAMRFLDNVIDDTHYFFEENEKVAKDIRRTGLGIMGIADTFIKMKIRYGSPESLAVSKKIFATLRDNSYIASADIAKEKGAFPKYNKEKYLQGYHIKALPKAIQDKIAKQGIRNAVLLTIAPTGTTSLVAGVSSGVEPVYEFEFLRKTKVGEAKMYHPLYDEWRMNHPTDERPDYFVSANDLTPEDHVKIQAIAQVYIDSSISKTVNAPNSHTIEDVKRLYMMSYDMGLKGIAYMRDGSRVGVLERIEEKKDTSASSAQAGGEIKPMIPITPVVSRPLVVSGVTYKTDSPIGKMYVTINHDDKQQPFEVFINNGKSGSDVMAMADALGRMISFVLRIHSPVPPRERMRRIISELSGIGGARSIGFGENKVRSLPDAVSKILAKHYSFRVNGKVEDRLPLPFTDSPTPNVAIQSESVANGESNGKVANGTSNGHTTNGNGVTLAAAVTPETSLGQLALDPSLTASMIDKSTTSLFDICPECGSGTLAYEEGCQKCYSCGYSAC